MNKLQTIFLTSILAVLLIGVFIGIVYLLNFIIESVGLLNLTLIILTIIAIAIGYSIITKKNE